MTSRQDRERNATPPSKQASCSEHAEPMIIGAETTADAKVCKLL